MYTMRAFRSIASIATRNLHQKAFINAAVRTSLLQNNLTFRSYSVLTPEPKADLWKYDAVKALTKTPSDDTIIIDVREKTEYEDGHIPGALNIPFKTSPGALALKPEDFQDAFGFSKPSKDKKLIFYCLGGVRSTIAEELAGSFGYLKRGNYVGSYEDWVAHESNQKTTPSN